MMTRKGTHTFSTLLAGLGCLALLALPQLGQQADAQTQPGREGNAKLVIGEKAPDFTLTDTEGNEHKLSKYLEEGNIVVLEWFNPGCPFVVRHHTQGTMKSTFDELTKDQKKDVVWFAINSGAPGKQGHGQELNQNKREEWKIEYPVLLDESGEVGRAYSAKTTPQMFIIAQDGKLLYQGAIDNDRRGNKRDGINYVDQALTQYFANQDIDPNDTRPYGCGVKYSN